MEFKLITSPQAFDALVEDWDELLIQSITNTPFLRHEYLRAWWETRGGGEWPQAELIIIGAYQGGRLMGIAPFFLAEREGLPSLFLLGSIEISDFLDLLVRLEDLAPFLGGLFDFINSSSLPFVWRNLDLFNLPENSPTLPVLQAESAKRGWTFTQEAITVAPYIPLPGDFETYLSGIDKKQRHEVRRKMRRAEESGRNVHWYIVGDGTKLDEEIDGFLSLMANDPEKAAFLTGAMRSQMHAIARTAFHSGWLQLAFLEVDGEKACGYLNFDYANKIWVYNSGLDRKFMDMSPGWVLLGYLLEWANLHKRLEFDFMRGNEEYKYKFGAVDRQVIRARVEKQP